MGQAQLLLIVLGVVLVGIAIVAGISAFEQNSRKGAQDALMHDALRIASDIQAWAQKPSQFGGPAAGSFGQVGTADFTKIGYTTDHDGSEIADANTWESTNGTFELSGTTTKSIVGTSTLYSDVQIGVAVCGINAADVLSQIGSSAPTCPTP